MNVKVLTEELAYNSHLKQYRMFIVDRPMVAGYHKHPQPKGGRKEELLAIRRTHSEHYKLLQCFENHREVCVFSVVSVVVCSQMSLCCRCLLKQTREWPCSVITT